MQHWLSRCPWGADGGSRLKLKTYHGSRYSRARRPRRRRRRRLFLSFLCAEAGEACRHMHACTIALPVGSRALNHPMCSAEVCIVLPPWWWSRICKHTGPNEPNERVGSRGTHAMRTPPCARHGARVRGAPRDSHGGEGDVAGRAEPPESLRRELAKLACRAQGATRASAMGGQARRGQASRGQASRGQASRGQASLLPRGSPGTPLAPSGGLHSSAHPTSESTGGIPPRIFTRVHTQYGCILVRGLDTFFVTRVPTLNCRSCN